MTGTPTDATGDPGVVVTTSKYADEPLQECARARAARWGVPYVPRHGRSLRDVRGSGTAVLFTAESLALDTPAGRLTFHEGTAAVRLRAMKWGHGDPMVRAGELSRGDRVLDASLGLGRDALVAAKAVGPTGEVLGVESSWALAVLVDEGLAGYTYRKASARVQVRHGNSRAVLAEAAQHDPFDVVLLDPMYPQAKPSDSGFALLRGHADHTPLDRDWLRLARRAATRWVLVKADREHPWFPDEGVQRVTTSGHVHWYRARGTARHRE